MRVLVTGGAGFIGSHLCERLAAAGDDVVALDCFTDYYSPTLKRANAQLLHEKGVRLVEADLVTADLETLLLRTDVVYHLAGQPGVRPSWGEEFAVYTRQNIRGTHRLLEAARTVSLKKLVYASSSSVYGDAETLPTDELVRPRPVSPYGVTKLAAEHLCEAYRTNFGIPTASLRLFTVFGPRQRPDMAFARMVAAATNGLSFPMFGDGSQTRDFTYVGDVVSAMLSAGNGSWTGVANIGGGSRTSMSEVVEVLRSLVGRLVVVPMQRQAGDVGHTAADTTLARRELRYAPSTSIEEGLALMVDAAAAGVARTGR